MADLIKELIEALRRGDYTDPAGKIAALAAAIKETSAEPEVVLSLLEAHQAALRLAGIDAAQGRDLPQISKALLQLTGDQEEAVRTKLALCAAHFAKAVRSQILKELASDSSSDVRTAAVKATAGMVEFYELQSRLLSQDSDSDVRLGAAEALGRSKSPKVLPVLFSAAARDDWYGVQEKCAEYIEEWLTQLNRYPGDVEVPATEILHKLERELDSIGAHRFPKLSAFIAEKTKVEIDLKLLSGYGVDLGADAETFPRAYLAEQPVKMLREKLTAKNPRGVILIGPSGSGKTAIVQEFARELVKAENGGWRVLRVQPSDLLVGTKYIGEWETRLATLVSAARRPRRVILYFPEIHLLAGVGRAERSESNAADALSAHIQDGALIVLGESTVEGLEKGLSAAPHFRKLFDHVLVEEAPLHETIQICANVLKESALEWPEARMDFLVQSAEQYLHRSARPGKAVTFLRQVISAFPSAPPEPREILTVLSRSTGIPVDILDDKTPLKPVEVRAFFESRVMGQPEAVNAVVDLVTLIKAGLTDPHKPFGVLLFVGPTGVGKTELARALAEFIFGSAGRLLRYDMSEYASHDGFERLIGTPKSGGLLTQAVYEQPFSLVLLDEIEKSHQNVFDLCLQLFDAGRLTDGKGRTIDFRRTIVILTSNVGANAGAVSTLGFGVERAPSVPVVDKDRTFRELSNFFRPEFLNRIDQIINFRALSIEVAENIARREVQRVIERAGITRRRLTVDVDAAVVSALVKEGYSPHFGARPLKRAVERMVLLPVARAIATGRLREQTLLRLAFEANQVKISILQDESAEAETPLSPSQRHEKSLAERVDEQIGRLDAVKERTNGFALRKSDLLAATQAPEFHQSADKANAFDEIYKLEQFLNAEAAVKRGMTHLRERVQRPVSESQRPALEDRLAELTSLLEQLAWTATCEDSRDLGDCYIGLKLVSREYAPIEGVRKLLAMYRGFARRRRLTCELIAESANETVFLHFSGMGAYGILKTEAGLHNFVERHLVKNPRTGRAVHQDSREVVRVETWLEAVKPFTEKELVIKTHPARSAAFIEKAALELRLFHSASISSLALIMPGAKKAAVEKALPLFSAQVQNPALSKDQDRLVRRYELGHKPKIRTTPTPAAPTAPIWFLRASWIPCSAGLANKITSGSTHASARQRTPVSL